MGRSGQSKSLLGRLGLISEFRGRFKGRFTTTGWCLLCIKFRFRGLHYVNSGLEAGILTSTLLDIIITLISVISIAHISRYGITWAFPALALLAHLHFARRCWLHERPHGSFLPSHHRLLIIGTELFALRSTGAQIYPTTLGNHCDSIILILRNLPLIYFLEAREWFSGNHLRR